MKVIANIPNEEIKIDTPIKELLQHATSCAVIPDDATNGDVIKTMFPNSAVCEPILEDDIIHVIFADKCDSAIGFDYSWWNAPYRGQQDD